MNPECYGISRFLFSHTNDENKWGWIKQIREGELEDKPEFKKEKGKRSI